ncbi:hypothetical protein KEM52_001508 [Ascosphaera acerosa]|nr:hypothetical protein KEM52_001508 [Ascosphaera acerosa]
MADKQPQEHEGHGQDGQGQQHGLKELGETVVSETAVTRSAETLRPSEEAAQRQAGAEAGAKAAEDGVAIAAATAGEEAPDGLEGGASAEATSTGTEMSKTKVMMIMFSLGMAVFLAALDMTIVTTALPTIVQDLEAAESSYTWIGSAYLLASAASSPSWGKISDIFGRKPVLLMSNVIFLVGSLICGLSKSDKMLIGGRVVQGLGGGGLLSLVNICIGDLFSIRKRSVMYAVIGIVWAIAGATGPVIGGLFTEYATWRWCFYINLIADGLALVSLIFFLRIETPRTPFFEGLRGIDWLGSVTCAGGTVMFLLGLNYGGDLHPWKSAIVICLIIFGVVVLGVFMAIEATVPRYPITPPWLLNSRKTLMPFLVCFLHGFVYTGMNYFLPLYFQTVLGATPILSGVYLFPLVGGIAIGSMGVGIVIRRTGRFRPPLWFGMCMFTLGLGLFVDLPLTKQWAKLVIYQILAGLGAGPCFQSPLIALQSQIKPADIATATSTFAFTRNIGSSMGVVIGGVVLTNVLHAKMPRLEGRVPADVYALIDRSSPGAMAEFVRGLPRPEARLIQSVYRDSLQMAWVFYTVLCFVGFLSSLLVLKKSIDQHHEVTKTGLAAQKEAREERLKEAAEKKARKAAAEQSGRAQEKDVEARAGAGRGAKR